jgi:hypothetical protein
MLFSSPCRTPSNQVGDGRDRGRGALAVDPSPAAIIDETPTKTNTTFLRYCQFLHDQQYAAPANDWRREWMAEENMMEREIKLAVPLGCVGAAFLGFIVAPCRIVAVPRLCGAAQIARQKRGTVAHRAILSGRLGRRDSAPPKSGMSMAVVSIPTRPPRFG